MKTEKMSKDQKINAVRSLVEDTLRNLVKNPDAVRVTVVGGTFNVIFEVSMPQEDIGRAVGTAGAHKKRLQETLVAIGKNHDLCYTIDRIREARP